VIASYHPLALRLFLVSTHYRQQVNYTQRALEEASDRLYYLFQALLDIQTALEGERRSGWKGRRAMGLFRTWVPSFPGMTGGVSLSVSCLGLLSPSRPGWRRRP
jgi:hypothetical protein